MSRRNLYGQLGSPNGPKRSDTTVKPERPRKVSPVKPSDSPKGLDLRGDVFSGALDANLPEIEGQLTLFPDYLCEPRHKGLTKKQRNCD